MLFNMGLTHLGSEASIYLEGLPYLHWLIYEVIITDEIHSPGRETRELLIKISI